MIILYIAIYTIILQCGFILALYYKPSYTVKSTTLMKRTFSNKCQGLIMWVKECFPLLIPWSELSDEVLVSNKR